MTFWLGNFAPERVLLDLGFIQVYWYSLFIVLAIIASYLVARTVYLKKNTSDKQFADLIFYVIIFGLIGARLWHVFVFQWGYYSQHIGEIVQVWQGGIAIQGAIIAAGLTIFLYSNLKKVAPWHFFDSIAVALPLGQAIGRWGNFFNQELYGWPLKSPWAIFIDAANRIPGFEEYSHFHPTFFYESCLNLLFFAILWYLAKKQRVGGFLTLVYLIGYGVIRFMIDFVRIDPMPEFYGLRSSQIISLVFIVIALIGYSLMRKRSTIHA
jgi:phosphatidylglycerol---prolipoprotein diacylglyceryl transferase